MSIRLVVAPIVSWRVEGTNREGSKDIRFDFTLDAERSSQDEVTAIFNEGSEQKSVDYLAPKLRGWGGVLGEDDRPAPYSEEAFRTLVNAYPGLIQLCFSGYLDAISAKGRRKN